MNPIVHLFPYEKFTGNFIGFINSQFSPAEHLIIVYGSYPGVELDAAGAENVLFIDSIFKLLPGAGGYRHLRGARLILLHSLAGPAARLMLLAPWLWKKSAVYFWGYEIYGFERKRPGVRNALYRFAISAVTRRVKYVLTILPADAEVLRRHVPYRGKQFSLRYGGSQVESGHNLPPEPEKPGPPWRFLLGNNATASNGHDEVLAQLAAYANCPMQVVTPLSYGDGDNALRVAALGKSILGNRFAPLTDFMPLDAYTQLLLGCRVAFFNNDRQQALGNIFTLLASDCKLYLRRATPLWNELAGAAGFKVFDIAEVGRVSFEELLVYSKKDAAHNRAALKAYTDPQRTRQRWADIFELP